MKKELIMLFVGAFLLASCNRNGSDNQIEAGAETDSVGSVSVSEPVGSVSASDSVGNVSAQPSEQSQDLSPVARPVACIGANINGGTYEKDIILVNPFVLAMSPAGIEPQLLWRVISYKVAFDKGDGKPLSHILVDTPRFPENVVSAIREASSGTRMIISDIKVRSDAGEFYAPDFTVTIK